MRLANWHTALSAKINEWRVAERVWGTTDCFHFAADCANAVNGVDLAVKFRGKYTTPLGSIKQMRKLYDADNLKELMAVKFGLEEVHPALAMPGDIVYVNSNAFGIDCALGVCYGLHSFFLDEDGGYVQKPTLTVDGAYRIA